MPLCHNSTERGIKHSPRSNTSTIKLRAPLYYCLFMTIVSLLRKFINLMVRERERERVERRKKEKKRHCSNCEIIFGNGK